MTVPTGEMEQYEGAELLRQHAGGVPEDLETGMDELEEGGYPRIRINHKEARYVESIGDTEYEVLDCIILGFSYSRVMWKETKAGQGFKSDKRPQCRSNDNKHGQPNTDIEKPDLFPWGDSVFDPKKAEVNPTYNRVILDCTKCSFQIWGSDGTRPACGLIMNVYVLFQPPGAPQPLTAFLSIKGAGIKPMKKFFQKVRSEGGTPYQFRVRLGLTQHTSGEVEYCTPTVAVTAVVEQAAWAILSDHYGQMRDFTKAILIEPEDVEITVNGFKPPVSHDPNFFMSDEHLKDGIEIGRIGGGRRSAPPPQRAVRELTSGQARDPLSSIMGSEPQTIQGTVVPNQSRTSNAQQNTQQNTQENMQVPRQHPPQPAHQSQPTPAPVTTDQPIGTPAQERPATPTPPQQSASAAPPASTPFPAPSGFMPSPMGFGMPGSVGGGVATAAAPEAAVQTQRMPWETEVPAAPAGYASPEVDSVPEEELDGDVTDESYPFT